MAFPTTGIVDDTTRTNEPALSNGGYWGTVSNARLFSNAVTAVGAAQFYAISSPTYGANAEVYATVQALPGTIGNPPLSLYLRFSLASSNYYICQLSQYQGSNTFLSGKFFKALAGVETEIFDTGAAVVCAPGNQFGFSANGTLLTAYINGTAVFSTTDSAVTAGGGLAFLGGDQNVQYQTIGGGTIITVPYMLALTGGAYVCSGSDMTTTPIGAGLRLVHTV